MFRSYPTLPFATFTPHRIKSLAIFLDIGPVVGNNSLLDQCRFLERSPRYSSGLLVFMPYILLEFIGIVKGVLHFYERFSLAFSHFYE